MECEFVEAPNGEAEEAMEAAPVPVADVSCREDDFGDEAVSQRKDPSRDDLDEGGEGGCREDGIEIL